jgi:hypothetical protein
MSSQWAAQVWKFSRFFVVLVLAGAVVGCAMCRCPAQPKREVRDSPYPVVYADVPPKIDGVLDDAVWKKAVPHRKFYVYSDYNKRVNLATAYLAWDKDNLYYAIEIKTPDLYAVEKEDDKPLCTADVAEFFVKPSSDHLDLYEFEFNLWNAVWYIHYISRGGGLADRFTVTSHPGLICRSTHRGNVNDWNDVDDSYTIEVAIPLKLFERAVPGGPKPGDRWKFNVCGYDFSCQREDTLLFSTCDGNTSGFHEYEIYPEMVFLAPGQVSPKAEW